MDRRRMAVAAREVATERAVLVEDIASGEGNHMVVAIARDLESGLSFEEGFRRV